MPVITGTLKSWRKVNKNVKEKTGIVVADDPKFGNILISESAFIKSGEDPSLVKNGDKITIEVIGYAIRVFK